MNTSKDHVKTNASFSSSFLAAEEQAASAAYEPAHVTEESKELMAALSIRYNGRHFCFHEYRYEHLEDAVAYVGLQRDRALRGLTEELASGAADTDTPELPSASERRAMEELGVSYQAGRYVFKGFHYDRLRDALAYARLERARGSGRI